MAQTWPNITNLNGPANFNTGANQHNNQGNRGRLIENQGKYNENNFGNGTPDLPGDVKVAFDEHFCPAVIEFVGCSKNAWNTPTSKELETIWVKVMPDPFKDQFSEFEPTIRKLVTEVLVSWRDSIASKAVETLAKVFYDQKLKSGSEKQKTYIREQTSGEYWKRAYYFPPGSKTTNGVPTGVFQSMIVSQTFSAHFEAIQSIPEDQRLKAHPVEALILTILAIERAFAISIEGGESNSHGKFIPTGHKVKPEELRAIFGKNQRGVDRISVGLWSNIIAAAKAHLEVNVGISGAMGIGKQGENKELPPDLVY
ncbi:hypothetical protein VKT23_018407 [Stygiomarasmius scandens]|uniref:Uncharacterized protein n=1 Tax=Marasmiellus scandens TaxID=2682957 RepID=A0ABR1IP51_9AGAR